MAGGVWTRENGRGNEGKNIEILIEKGLALKGFMKMTMKIESSFFHSLVLLNHILSLSLSLSLSHSLTHIHTHTHALSFLS